MLILISLQIVEELEISKNSLSNLLVEKSNLEEIHEKTKEEAFGLKTQLGQFTKETKDVQTETTKEVFFKNLF